jgi:Zn-dependent oligopeptidase
MRVAYAHQAADVDDPAVVGPCIGAAGSRFRRDILAVGGSRDAMASFVAFRGRPPELDPLLRQAGIVA